MIEHINSPVLILVLLRYVRNNVLGWLYGKFRMCYMMLGRNRHFPPLFAPHFYPSHQKDQEIARSQILSERCHDPFPELRSVGWP